jgi:hypothetical protein
MIDKFKHTRYKTVAAGPVRLCLLHLTCLLCGLSPLSAQVNTEKFFRPDGKDGLSGYVEIDLSHRGGNVNVSEVDLETSANYRWSGMRSYLVLRSDYGWKDGSRFSDEALVHARNLFRTERALSPELFLQVDSNRRRLLQLRSLAGGGLRYNLKRSQGSRALIGASIMIENERYDLPVTNGHPEQTTVIRWSSYFSANGDLNQKADWSLIAYFQPQINDFGDLRLIGEGNFRVELLKKLYLVTSLSFRHDNRPPDGIKKLDTKIESGIAWSF